MRKAGLAPLSGAAYSDENQDTRFFMSCHPGRPRNLRDEGRRPGMPRNMAGGTSARAQVFRKRVNEHADLGGRAAVAGIQRVNV